MDGERMLTEEAEVVLHDVLWIQGIQEDASNFS